MNVNTSPEVAAYLDAIKRGDEEQIVVLREQVYAQARASIEAVNELSFDATRLKVSVEDASKRGGRKKGLFKAYKELIGMHRQAKELTNRSGEVKRAMIKEMQGGKNDGA